MENETQNRRYLIPKDLPQEEIMFRLLEYTWEKSGVEPDRGDPPTPENMHRVYKAFDEILELNREVVSEILGQEEYEGFKKYIRGVIDELMKTYTPE
jgi:hypothetical protein